MLSCNGGLRLQGRRSAELLLLDRPYCSETALVVVRPSHLAQPEVAVFGGNRSALHLIYLATMPFPLSAITPRWSMSPSSRQSSGDDHAAAMFVGEGVTADRIERKPLAP